MVAAAVIGGAVVGGVATTVAGNRAARAQRDASRQATDAELQMYNQTREDLAPFREAGYDALKDIRAGQAPGGDFNRDFTLADFQQDPGYQFRMDQGTQALERSAAARGGLLNGGTLKALSRYGQDFASGEYSNAYNRFNADRDRRFNRLATVAGVGQTATNSTAAAGSQATSGIVDAINARGNANAARSINTGNAINNVAGSLGQYYLYKDFMGK